MNDEGLADVEAANPSRLPRLHPGVWFACGAAGGRVVAVIEGRLVTGQRLGVALALWAVLAALETGSSTSLKLGLALGIALAVIDGQAVHAVSVRPLAAGLVTNALHVAAMATWVGTVIALLVAWRAAAEIGRASCRERV